MNLVTNIILDLSTNNRKSIAELKQTDRSTRTLRFTLLDGNKPLDMSDVLIKGIKPDETVVYAAAEIEKDEEGNNKNVVNYTISDHVTEASGEITCELQLVTGAGEIIQSFDFYIDVINQLYDEDDILSESDLSGFKAYMIRTLNAALITERTKNAFEDTYGTISTIAESLEQEITDCQAFLEELQRLLDTGAFIGPRGPQGENGTNGVIVEGSQVVAFDIVDDELVCYYVGEEEPDIEMNDDGELQWNY